MFLSGDSMLCLGSFQTHTVRSSASAPAIIVGISLALKEQHFERSLLRTVL